MKGDYANAGKLQEYSREAAEEGQDPWIDWYDEDTDIENPREYLEYLATN